MDVKNIGENLKMHRKAQNFTAGQVSDYLKENGYPIEKRSIYGYEDGSRMPKADVFLHLCRLYGCTDVLYEFGYGEKMTKDAAEEEEIINLYRKLNDREKDVLKGFMGILLNARNDNNKEDEED